MYVRVNGCMNELKDVHEVSIRRYVRFHSVITDGENQSGLENLEKDSPLLFLFFWDERLHLDGSQEVMELVHMHEGLVWFLAVA